MKRLPALLIALFCFATPIRPTAQQPRLLVTTDAPIFLLPDERRVPLYLAKSGTELGMRDKLNDEWYEVDFRGAAYGDRVGFVQAKNVRRLATEAHRVPPRASSRPQRNRNLP
jgi:hypothetical protein